MKRLIERLYYKIHIHFLPKKKSLVKKMWYDNNIFQVFLHANIREPLFYIPVLNISGTVFCYFLFDIEETKRRNLTENEAIYRLVSIVPKIDD